MISMQGCAFFQTESAAERFYNAIPELPHSRWKSIKSPQRHRLLCRILSGANGWQVAWYPYYD